MSWWNALLPVATLLIGFGTSYFSDLGKDRRAESRENAARGDARRDRREAFELQVLQPDLGELEITITPPGPVDV